MGNSLARAFFGDDFEGYEDFDFSNQDQVDAWWKATEEKGFGAPYSADLGAYRDAGGKVIFWNGVSNPCCLDSDLARYRNAAGQRVGGPRGSATDRFGPDTMLAPAAVTTAMASPT